MKNFSYLSLKPGNALVKSHSTLNGREQTFHRQVEEWLSQQQARFLTCVPQKQFNEKEKLLQQSSHSWHLRWSLNKSTAFRRDSEFYSTQEQFKSDQKRRLTRWYRGFFIFDLSRAQCDLCLEPSLTQLAED